MNSIRSGIEGNNRIRRTRVAEMSDEASSAEASEAGRGLGTCVDANNNQELVNCQCYLSLDPYPSQHQWR